MHSLKLFNLFRKKIINFPETLLLSRNFPIFPKFPEFCRSELDKITNFTVFVGLNLTKMLTFLYKKNKIKMRCNQIYVARSIFPVEVYRFFALHKSFC